MQNIKKRIALGVIAAILLENVSIFAIMSLRNNDSDIAKLTFVRIQEDAKWPSTVRVYGAVSDVSSDDSIFLFVEAEPKMFGARFEVTTEYTTVRVELKEHAISGTGKLYSVNLPRIHELCNRSRDQTIGLRSSVRVKAFVGWLK